MHQVTCCKTDNRSVIDMLNQISYLADGYQDHLGLVEPLAISLKLAGKHCGPLY